MATGFTLRQNCTTLTLAQWEKCYQNLTIFLISIEQRKTSLHATANFGDVAVIGWFKFFNWSSILFCFKKWKLFPFAARKGNFSKQVDRLTFACGNFFFWSILGHCGLVGRDFWPGFGRIRSDFFVFCIVFFYVLRNCVKQLRRFFVKSKKWKHYLRDACQIIHWWRYFLCVFV